MTRRTISKTVCWPALIWLCVAVLLGVSAAAANADVFLTNSGTITGVVRNESGDPIEGALVYAYGDDWGYDYTGANGSYSIAALDAGEYVLSAEASGYASEYYNNVYDWSSATLVLVADLTDTSNINFTLGPGGSISGVIGNDSSAPIEGAWVCAEGDCFGDYYTAADGRYSITDLAPGSYVVWAQASGYASEYYDDVYDWSSATPVTVTVGNETAHVDLALGPGGSISGVVEDESSDPVEGALVYVNDNPWGRDYSGADGSYSIADLAAGSYIVWAQASGYNTEYYNNVYDLSSATPVTVTALNDTSGIDFTLASSSTTPPVVTSNYATSLGTNSARMNGFLGSLGSASSVTVSFQWGTSSGSYPNETTGQAKASTGAFYYDLGNLSPSTTYYYRAKAVGDDTSYGAEKNFSTLTPPTATTNDASGIGTNSARLNGFLTSLGSASSVAVSFQWGTSPGSYPNESAGQAKSSTGAFYHDLGSLSPNTNYYYRAKASGDGMSLGLEESFTTITTPPYVTTDDGSEITSASATLNGTLGNLGTALSVQVSFQWGPTASYGYTTTPQTMSAIGAFSASISGLNAGTTYHYRARAVGDGADYGDDMTFTTAPLPSVVTYSADNVTTNSARLNGSLNSPGSASIVTVSFEWGTTLGGPYTETSSENMTSTGPFHFDLSGLNPASIYYYRAKAIGNGTSYGVERSFETYPTSPLVATCAASIVTTNSAQLNGELTWLGTATTVTVSFEWGTTPGGPYSSETAGQAKTSEGAFYFDQGSLAPGTIYYYRAKADGDGDPVYGEERSFTTDATPPGVSTEVATDVTINSARLNGDLASLGTASSVTVSFVWGTSPAAYPNETTGQAMTRAGKFYFDLTGLDPNTIYYYRAKAVVDGSAAVYGSDKLFNSKKAPSVTTDGATSVTIESARLNGNLTGLGTADSVAISFVWGTTSGSLPNETTAIAKASIGAFYFDLNGLEPGSTYYFRAKAVGDDTTYGDEKSLTTGRTPDIATVDPGRGKRGKHLTITISGSNFEGATGVSFGPGITVEDFDVTDSSEILAEIAIDDGAEVGLRDVAVTTEWGTGTEREAFSVAGGGGGICSCWSSNEPVARSEMIPTLAAVGLLLGAGHWLVKRRKRDQEG